MRRRLIVRAATLLLALLMPLAGVRAAQAACCVDEGCDLPCCQHDEDNATVLPVLPCCRTVATDQTSHPAPSNVEKDQLSVVAPSVFAAPLLMAAVGSLPPPSFGHLPAPPLYQQHCALLL